MSARAVFPVAALVVAAFASTACRSAPHAREFAPRQGVVVCEQPLAAEVGAAILERGGNAADAAVATALALAVVYPQAGNLGGGGFALWVARDGAALALDFRECAPSGADRARFFDDEGRALEQLPIASVLGVGVPGSPAGLAELLERCGSGRLTLAELCAPAIALARDGFEVDAQLARDLLDAEDRPRLEGDAASAALFYPSGRALERGERLRQSDLARTLERFARGGPDGFYAGATAEALVATLAARAAELPAGERWDAGWVTAADLRAYRCVAREPLRGAWRGREIVSMPPPSSGGIILLQVLGVLERFELDAQRGRALANPGADALACGLDERAVHWWIEALRRSFEARAGVMGDPDFVDVPLDALLSPTWLRGAREAIGEHANVPPAPAARREGTHTTHLSVLDSAGNAVSLTTTLNSSFGSGMLARGAGFLLNNELDDFSLGGAVRNQFGLVGGAANAIAPGKRPLSSMTPAIVLRDGRVELVLGSPGGPRIITAVIAVLLRTLVYDEALADAVAAPRFHQQWSPSTTRFEAGWPSALLEALRRRGQPLEIATSTFGSVQAIRVHADGSVEGVSDPRRGGAARFAR